MALPGAVDAVVAEGPVEAHLAVLPVVVAVVLLPLPPLLLLLLLLLLASPPPQSSPRAVNPGRQGSRKPRKWKWKRRRSRGRVWLPWPRNPPTIRAERKCMPLTNLGASYTPEGETAMYDLNFGPRRFTCLGLILLSAVLNSQGLLRLTFSCVFAAL